MGGEKALAFLLTTIAVEERRRRRRGWRNMFLAWCGLFAAQFGLGFLIGSSGNYTFFIGMLGFAFLLGIIGGAPSCLHRQCVKRLVTINDRRVFSGLVAALVNPYQIQVNVVARRLIHMLPEMEVADFAVLPLDHRERFFNCINPKFASVNQNADAAVRRELARALLLTVTRTGIVNSEALRVTGIVANAKSKAGRDDTLQRTAQNCLPLLEKARDEQKAKVTEERKVVVRR